MINFLSSTNFTLDYKEIAIQNDNKFLQNSSSCGNLCLLKHTHTHTLNAHTQTKLSRNFRLWKTLKTECEGEMPITINYTLVLLPLEVRMHFEKCGCHLPLTMTRKSEGTIWSPLWIASLTWQRGSIFSRAEKLDLESLKWGLSPDCEYGRWRSWIGSKRISKIYICGHLHGKAFNAICPWTDAWGLHGSQSLPHSTVALESRTESYLPHSVTLLHSTLGLCISKFIPRGAAGSVAKSVQCHSWRFHVPFRELQVFLNLI